MPFFISAKVADNIAISLGVVLFVLACRWLGEWLLSQGVDPVTARQRRFTIRAIANALLALCLLGVWLSEIQNLVLSLAAVMVALVVATKELIMCFAGAILRFGGKLFKVGDRIEMNGVRGEVVDHGLLSTTIIELPSASLGHAGTGRRLTIPNSAFLSTSVRVEPQPRHFSPHRFTVTLEFPVAVSPALARLEAQAERAVAEDRERAARFHRMTVAKIGADIAGPGFEVTLGTSEIGKLQFHVMLYCLVQDARALEQAVTIGFLADLDAVQNEPTKSGRPSESWADLSRKLREPRAQSNAA